MLKCALLLCLIGSSFGIDPSTCGDWEPYKDEKCFKILTTVGSVPFEDAKTQCKVNFADSQLLSIKDDEEETFLMNFLFNKSMIVDPVWIDARFQQGKLKREYDDSDQIYTNWASGRPKNTIDSCVKWDPEFEQKWIDEPCRRSARVVCELNQWWTVNRLQLILRDTIKRLDATQNRLSEVQTQANDTQDQLVESKNQSIHTQSQLAEARTQLSNVQIQATGTQNRLEEAKNQATNIQNRLTEAETQLAAAQRQTSSTQNQLTEAKNQLANVQSQATNTQNQLEETRNQFAETKVQLTHVQTQATNTQNQLAEAKNLLGSVQTQATNTQNQLAEMRNQLATVQTNSVPIGFVYVQFSGQPEPTALWPSLQWADISGTYAGLFFRAAGGNAAPFGATQEENSPRLVAIKFFKVGLNWNEELNIPANGEYVGRLLSGSVYTKKREEHWYGNAYKVSAGEVRPRNQAIRVWKRVG